MGWKRGLRFLLILISGDAERGSWTWAEVPPCRAACMQAALPLRRAEGPHLLC